MILTVLAFAPNAYAGDISGSATVEINKGSSYSAPATERVSTQTYIVSVDGDGNDSRRKVLNKALVKAAKKTLKYDYDWFRIVERETDKETRTTRRRGGFEGSFHTVPERRCGLLSCRTTTRTYYSGGVSSDFPDREDTVYTVTLEFRMGIGPVQDTDSVYDARQVKRDLD